MSTEQLQGLCKYTACDISDALLKLKVPHAGFLADLLLQYAPSPSSSTPIVAPATTVLLAPKSSTSPPSTLAPGTHFADTVAAPSTIAVLSAPAGTRCAVMGGLVAKRLAVRGVVGAVIDGRVRDLTELPETWEVWAGGVSTVGAGAETRVVGVDCEVVVRGVTVRAGDAVFCDRSAGGVVVIPRDLVGRVLEMLPGMVATDGLVDEDLEAGVELGEAFKRRRG